MDFITIVRKQLLVIVIILTACEGPAGFYDRPFTENSLFPGTERILVKEYIYYINDDTYIVRADLATLQNPDTVPVTPSFSWNSTGRKLVTVAIFNSRIEVNNNSILNENNIVWMWNTGIGSGTEGSISYFDGRSVDNGNLLEKEQLMPLTIDSLYTWAVWAWDKTGTEITKSSRELWFIVE